MLRLILGRAGSGKSELLLEKAVSLAKEKRESIIIVPEQASFETERAVLAKLGVSDARFVEVLSFTRLCERIFRKEGFFKGKRIDESGKAVIMNNALEEVCDSLSVYKKHGRGTGLINIMLSAVTEFKTRAITPEELSRTVVTNRTLAGKLKDISTIYGAYEAILEQTGLDPLDDLAHACEKLEGSEFFRGKTVMVDSFKSFTPCENKMLSYIMRDADDLYIALCADSLNGEALFAPTVRTANSLIRLAKKSGVQIAAPQICDSVNSDKAPALAALEKNLFSYNGEKISGSDGVRVFSAATCYEECRLAAGEISRLVREEGLRYRDIAIVARNFDDYANIIEDVFEKYSLPVFFDRRESVLNAPLVKLVLSAFDIVCRGFYTDDIFIYLKTDLTEITPQESAALENYAAVWQINGKRWTEPFTADPRGFSDSVDEEKTAQIENLRLALVTPLQEFAEKLKSENSRVIAQAVYELLMSLNVPERLMQTDTEDGKNMRLWELLMDMLDELTALHTEPIDGRKFAELLRLMLSTADMGFIPQGLDEITAGAADRIRLGSQKAVWILGVNEGVFPMPPPSGSIFSENERRMLIDKGLNMADTAEMCVEDEKMLAYMTVCAPSQRLYISFARGKCDGSSMSRSELVDAVLDVIPDLKIESDENIDPLFLLSTERAAFSEAAARWNEITPFAAALRSYFEENENWRDRTDSLKRAIEKTKLKIDSSELTHSLYGDNMRVSASKVEIYHQCKFQYFCRYALAIQKRRPAKLDALEYGKVMHFVFEKMISVHGAKGLGSMSDSELENSVMLLLDEYICENMGGWEDKTERFKYLYKRMSVVLMVLLKRMAAEFAQSEFAPVDFELQIGRGGDIPSVILETPNGEKIAVEGFVDRVDVMEKDGVSYVRVVDYKTGTKKFDLNEVLYGINLQMLIYLLTIDKNGRDRYGNVVPAGILYMSAKRPKAEDGRETPDMPFVESSGLLLEDSDVIRGMEKELAGKFIPVKIKKNGEFSSADCLASLEEIGELSMHIEKLLTEMAQSLYEGDIEAISALDGKYCDFCDYSTVCGHEKADGGKPFIKLDRDEIFEEIRKKECE